MNVKTSYIKFLVSLLIFGTNGIVASHINLSSYEIVFTRLLIGSPLLIVIFALSRQKLQVFLQRKHMIFLAASGVAMGLSWLFLFEAYRQIGVGIASLIYNCGPVIIMILSPLLFREKMTWVKVAGFLTVMIGMFCVNIQMLTGGEIGWGLFCGAMSAIMYASMVIFNKKASNIGGLEKSMWQLMTGLLTIMVFLAVKQEFAIRIASDDWIAIMILGIVNTGIACYFYFSSIGDLPVQTVAVFSYLEPLSAVIFSMMFLHERMTIVQVVGAVLILGGAAFSELFSLRNKRESDKSDSNLPNSNLPNSNLSD